MIQFKVKRINNHWYPCIPHELGYVNGFNEKISRFLNKLDEFNMEELTFEFEEVGVIFFGDDIIYINEFDITRYLTTDDDMDIRFNINDYEFTIHSDLFWMLEDQFNFRFHQNSYRINIY